MKFFINIIIVYILLLLASHHHHRHINDFIKTILFHLCQHFKQFILKFQLTSECAVQIQLFELFYVFG